jgi:hypothetical protein
MIANEFWVFFLREHLPRLRHHTSSLLAKQQDPEDAQHESYVLRLFRFPADALMALAAVSSDWGVGFVQSVVGAAPRVRVWL